MKEIQIIQKKVENIKSKNKFRFEKDFCKWFERNYRKLGITKILKIQKRKFLDYFVVVNKKILRIEIETLSSHFIAHKYDPKKVDLVICLKKDRKIPVKVVELNTFVFIVVDKCSINIKRVNKNKMRIIQ